MINYIVCFLISTLMGMGVGGGGLFVIYLTLCLNYPQILAQGTNLVFFIISIVASLLIHFRRRHINLKQVLTIITFGSFGSLLLSRIANHVNPSIPKVVLGILLVTSGVFTIINIIKNKI